MSPRPESLYLAVATAVSAVRRHAGIALGALALALLSLVLLVGWAVGSAWARPTPLPLLLDLLLAAAAIGLVVYWKRRLRPQLDHACVAAAAERRHGLAAGSLRGVLELHQSLPPGTSPALVARAEGALAHRLAGVGARALAGDVGEGWARRARVASLAAGAVLLSIAMLAAVAPERTRAGWGPLLNPVGQMLPPDLPPLVVEPGDAQVQRGEALEVQVLASGREAVLLRWHLAGDVAREEVLTVSGDTARGAIPAVDAAGEYWVEAPDGARSERYRVRPVDALLLSQLAVDVLYPAYLQLPAEHYEGDVPLLELPVGTTLRISGRATRPLGLAALQGARASVQFPVSERSFEGRWTPTRAGLYSWVLEDLDGSNPVTAPAPIEVVLVPDAAPTVEVTFPGTDTVFEPDLKQPLAALARDDHGLASAVLVSWRVSASGERSAPVEVALPLEQLGDAAVLRTVLDASERGLVPGDTLKYFVRVVDGSPARQAAVSVTYSLRLPGADELRRRAEQDAEEALSEAEALQKRTADLVRQTRNAERNAQASNARRASRASRGGADPGGQGTRMRFEETRDARRILEQQQAVNEHIEQLRGSLEQLEQSMSQAGLRDPELERRLKELHQLLEELVTPEMRRQLQALEQSVEQLSPEEMERALERLAEQQEKLKEQLEKSLELLQRAAAEQELNALAQEARELSRQQEALAREHEKQEGESQQRAAQQQQLAQKGEQLARELGQAAERLEAQGARQAAEQARAAAEQAREAQERMQQSAREAAGQQSRAAAEQGRQAAEQLRQAAAELEATRRELADGMRQQAEEEMQQATRDALSLAQRQQELQQKMVELQQGSEQQPEQSQPTGQQQQGQEGQQAAEQRRNGGQASQSGQQRGEQQAGRQSGQQQGAQQGGQQRSAEGGGQQKGEQQGQGQGANRQGGGGGEPQASELAQLQAEQRAIQEGLEQLGRNLSEMGRKSGMVQQEVGAALNRAHTATQQTQQGLEQAGESGQLPTQEAGNAVDALNRLALSLLNNAQQIQQHAQGGGGTQQAMDELLQAAQQQSSMNGQANALQPLGLSQSTTGEQARQLAQGQQQIAQQLEGMSNLLGGREDVLGQIDALAREAEALARELSGGRLTPETRARQAKLFHRLLDAGRLLEQEETSDERVAERPGRVEPLAPGALDPRLLENGNRYRVPSAEELRMLPPAYRRLILDYFERLNRPAPPQVR